jgi:tetratricopeptide (TPR) repeat protein
LFLVAPAAWAQTTPSGGYRIIGKVLTPITSFQDLFEVRLVHESQQLAGVAMVAIHDQFVFKDLGAGTYFLVVAIPGFKNVSQRVDVGTNRDAGVVIYLEAATPSDETRPLDLSGEEVGVIDAAYLNPQPQHLIDDVEIAGNETRNGEIAKAITRLESVVGEAPDFYEARKALGAAYQKAQRYRDAEVEYNAAKDLRPSSAAPWISLGSLFIEEAQAGDAMSSVAVRRILNEALGSLLTALDLNPKAAFAYYLLGVTYYECSLFEDAEDNLKRAMEVEPRITFARLALVNVYMRIRDWPSALLELDAYLAANPDNDDRARIENLYAKIEGVLDKESHPRPADGSN